jgi:hypothetical protein
MFKWRSLSCATTFSSRDTKGKVLKMTKTKIAITALGAAFMIGSTATAFAAPRGDHPRMRPEVTFIHLLKVADADKDGKISQAEFTAYQDGLFTAADKDKDGSVTPKEMRELRQAKMEEFRAANPRPERGLDDKRGPDHRKGEHRADRGEDGPRGERRAEGPRGEHGWGKGRHGGKGAGFALIRMADSDENGQLSKAEVTEAGNKLFERMDRNKDGAISIDDIPNRPFL